MPNADTGPLADIRAEARRRYPRDPKRQQAFAMGWVSQGFQSGVDTYPGPVQDAYLAGRHWQAPEPEPRCDTCLDAVPDGDFREHNRAMYVRHLHLTGELHLLTPQVGEHCNWCPDGLPLVACHPGGMAKHIPGGLDPDGS
jgi:hypothetical protein